MWLIADPSPPSLDDDVPDDDDLRSATDDELFDALDNELGVL